MPTSVARPLPLKILGGAVGGASSADEMSVMESWRAFRFLGLSVVVGLLFTMGWNSSSERPEELIEILSGLCACEVTRFFGGVGMRTCTGRKRGRSSWRATDVDVGSTGWSEGILSGNGSGLGRAAAGTSSSSSGREESGCGPRRAAPSRSSFPS